MRGLPRDDCDGVSGSCRSWRRRDVAGEELADDIGRGDALLARDGDVGQAS